MVEETWTMVCRTEENQKKAGLSSAFSGKKMREAA
jgi:hypothetical protein